jgi:hypothetical protein
MEREQSEFNSAISYLNRINLLFYQANEASMNLDGFGWFHSLMAIYRELSTEFKPDELEKFQSEKNRLANLLNHSISLQNRGRSRGFPQELYDGLDNFELELRRVMKESGLQMKMKEDASHALM